MQVVLLPIASLAKLVPDIEICTTLVERWRPDANTFHVYHEECTITLKDVTFLADVPLDDDVFFGEYKRNGFDSFLVVQHILWEEAC
ncbi:Serine/threonine-protein phosphatase 7 long form homolog [Linum grandiflorum]